MSKVKSHKKALHNKQMTNPHSVITQFTKLHLIQYTI